MWIFLFAEHKNKPRHRRGETCARPFSLPFSRHQNKSRYCTGVAWGPMTFRNLLQHISLQSFPRHSPARGLLLSIETKVTKSSLLSTAREVAEIEVSTKLYYRLHRAYNNSSALPPHRTQNPLSKTHTLLCPAISKAKKKKLLPTLRRGFFSARRKAFLILGFI